MPVQEMVFTVRLNQEQAWEFMTDRQKTCRLFPGCRDLSILNELDSLWTVRLSFGPFSRTFTMRGQTTEMKPLERFSWTAGTDHITTAGTVSFRPVGKDETEIAYRMEVRMAGPFSLLHDGLVTETVKHMLETFVANVKKHLEPPAAV